MSTELSVNDIDHLQTEIELGARTREDSMESGASSRPLNQSATKSSWLQYVLAVLVLILYIIVIIDISMKLHDDHEHDDEVVMSSSTSVSGYDLKGALYAGQGEWVDKLDTPLPIDGVSDLQVVACGDSGKIYLLGGSSSDTTVQDLVQEFDPAFETYTTKTPMPTPRYRFGAACYNGIIYVTGGFTTTAFGDAGQSVAATYAYDVATDAWTTGLADLTDPRGDIAMAAVDGKLYTFGGYGYEYSPADTVVEIYDIATDTWTVESAPIPSRRGDAVAVAVGTDVYLVGGWIDEYPIFTPSKSVEKFNTVTNTWSAVADMEVARGDCAVAALGDKLYVIGGESSTGEVDEFGFSITNVPLHDVEQYDIANDIWIRMAPIPSPRFRFGAAASGETIFTFGGHAQGVQTVDTVQAFYYVDRPNIFLHEKRS